MLSSDSDDDVPLPRRPAPARVNTAQIRPPQVWAHRAELPPTLSPCHMSRIKFV